MAASNRTIQARHGEEQRNRMPHRSQVQVVVGSRVEYIDALHAMAEEMAKLAGMGEDERFHFAMAVREAATNAVTHGNGQDPDKKVTVRFALGKSDLSVSIGDQGEGFDFEHTADPRLPENRFKPSGRGLLLIKSFVDEVSYEYSPGEGTEIRLVKHLAG
jgi:serine/threonine-protein kinase RsbW